MPEWNQLFSTEVQMRLAMIQYHELRRRVLVTGRSEWQSITALGPIGSSAMRFCK